MNTFTEVEQKIAESLLQIKAIKLQPKNPFTWASGWKSPVYCDNRVTLSHPAIRTYIRQEISKRIQEEFETVDMVSGVAMGGIPQGVLVAQDLGLPFTYVRSSPKGHGRQNLIEGEVVSGQRVAVVEDLVSTGKSSLQAVEALRQVGCNVVGLVSIFSYGFGEAVENFAKAKCPFFSLSNYDALILVGLEKGYVLESEVALLENWRKDPAAWTGLSD